MLFELLFSLLDRDKSGFADEADVVAALACGSSSSEARATALGSSPACSDPNQRAELPARSKPGVTESTSTCVLLLLAKPGSGSS